MSSTIAVLFAAGKGSRLLPLTETTPKPLTKIHGIPLIETSINALICSGVEKIYIVVGYKKEYFYYLSDKYPEVQLIVNEEYYYKNSISSFFAAMDVFGDSDCFICDADLYITNHNIFNFSSGYSCYFGKFIEGYTNEWTYEVDNERIVDFRIGGEHSYNWVGITYWKQSDVIFLKDAIRLAYQKEDHCRLYWDVYISRFFDLLNVKVHSIAANDVIEIDTIADLCLLDESYKSSIL